MRAFHVGFLAMSVVLSTSPANAQTLFSWPDTTVNIAAYTTIEECQAVVSRTLEYTAARNDLVSGRWGDTLSLVDSLEIPGMKALPSPVTETVRRCGARFANADSVPLTLFTVLGRLYLQAGWDAKARALMERRLAAIEPKDDTERAAVIDTIVQILKADSRNRIGLRRSTMAREIVAEHLPKVSDRVKRLRVYSDMMNFAVWEKPQDSVTARVLRLANKMAIILDSLTERELDDLLSNYGILGEGIDNAGDFAARYYALINGSLGKRAFLDSLRRSTAAYVKVKLDNWTRATGMRPEAYYFGNDPLGEHAPPIEADIWLGHDPASGPRPAPGRVSLVVFLNSHECNGVITSSSRLYGNCTWRLAPLSRLEKRFPKLEITVVGQSNGYFLYLKEGVTPEKEAALTKQWLETHGVDAPLAMTTRDFWRLPDPDGRRMNSPTDNSTNYSFGRNLKIANGRAFLIDQDGIVVHASEMNLSAVFEDFTAMIEILLQRQVTGVVP